MTKTITTTGGDLFHLAARHLGDATQAWRIAQANSLTDFQLQGLVTLTIPDRDPSQTGGLPPQ